MIFLLCVMLYFCTRAIIESIHFDGDDGYNRFFFGIDEYHIYRAMETVLVFLMILTYNGFGIIYLAGAFLVGDFCFERIYNLVFGRWISPYPFKFYKWTIKKRWWYPLAELVAGIWLLMIG